VTVTLGSCALITRKLVRLAPAAWPCTLYVSALTDGRVNAPLPSAVACATVIPVDVRIRVMFAPAAGMRRKVSRDPAGGATVTYDTTVPEITTGPEYDDGEAVPESAADSCEFWEVVGAVVS
jgi:hypothetical protein